MKIAAKHLIVCSPDGSFVRLRIETDEGLTTVRLTATKCY
jgi:hypothetical protein